ncbi:hypothetical protein LR68_02379 [Anoxybacillus sp. BCO1]|nr:hypothetical protein LR68_02379 [Anoxybacillus sp. BCO1]
MNKFRSRLLLGLVSVILFCFIWSWGVIRSIISKILCGYRP